MLLCTLLQKNPFKNFFAIENHKKSSKMINFLIKSKRFSKKFSRLRCAKKSSYSSLCLWTPSFWARKVETPSFLVEISNPPCPSMGSIMVFTDLEAPFPKVVIWSCQLLKKSLNRNINTNTYPNNILWSIEYNGAVKTQSILNLVLIRNVWQLSLILKIEKMRKIVQNIPSYHLLTNLSTIQFL